MKFIEKLKSKEGLKTFFTLILFLIIFIVALSCIKIQVLYIDDGITNELLTLRKLKKDSYIGIVYTHSVEKTETSEWYKVENEKLILMEERFKSQGAGLPTVFDWKFESKDGNFRFYDINKPFDSFIYRAGMVIANHRLVIDGKEEPFLNFAKPREPVRFSVRKISLLNYLKWRCSNG